MSMGNAQDANQTQGVTESNTSGKAMVPSDAVAAGPPVRSFVPTSVNAAKSVAAADASENALRGHGSVDLVHSDALSDKSCLSLSGPTQARSVKKSASSACDSCHGEEEAIAARRKPPSHWINTITIARIFAGANLTREWNFAIGCVARANRAGPSVQADCLADHLALCKVASTFMQALNEKDWKPAHEAAVKLAEADVDWPSKVQHRIVGIALEPELREALATTTCAKYVSDFVHCLSPFNANDVEQHADESEEDAANGDAETGVIQNVEDGVPHADEASSIPHARSESVFVSQFILHETCPHSSNICWLC